MPNRPVASTKLTIPRPTRTVVPRASLVARLDDPSWRIGIVAAPAGFGKTTLMSAWALELDDRPAWYTCDSSDAVPVGFWSGLIRSLAARWPGVGDDARVSLARSGAEERHVVVSLANDLADVAAGSLVVIDDLHNAAPAPSVLAAFLSALPPDVRLLIGSRRRPPFSMARRRLDGDLLELHTDDLRFALTETTAMLEHHAIELTTADVTRLQEQTEGWPAALQLSAMSLGRTSDHGRYLDALTSVEGPMADYLVSEVLAGLPDAWVEFLLVTSVLDEFDVELCERVTGRPDAWSILHELIDAEMFVIPVDESGEWYRYHHLFGAIMQARLRAQGIVRLRQVHAEAATALAERGLVVRAMRHALANNDGELTAAIARGGFDMSMYPVDDELTAGAARLWLHERGRDTVASDPVTVLDFIAVLQSSAGSDDVADWLGLVTAAHPDPSANVTVQLQGIWADHHLGHGQIGEAIRCVDVAMDLFDDAPTRRGLLPLIYAVDVRAHLAAGDVDHARATLDRVDTHPVGHRVLDDVRLPSMRAWVAYLDGDLTLAMELADASVRCADAIGVRLSQNEPGRVFAAVVTAGVHLERLCNAAAATALASVSHDLGGRWWYQCFILLNKAAAARIVGEAADAATHLALARLTMSRPSAEVEAAFALEAARQAVRFEPWAAAPLVDALGGSAAASALRVHLALECGERGLAEAAIASVPAPTTTRQAVEYGMLRALASRDTETALVHLDAALAAAAPERYVRTIIEAGPGVPELLAARPARSTDQGYVDMLLAASVAVIPPVRTGAAERLIDPLSERELLVLRYLSSHLTNAEIAAALYVSVNTMKTHVKTVYRKLAVSSRAEAVEAGRRKRLI